MMETNVLELPNGLRVLHKYVPYTRVVHCGYVVNAGSRDDREDEVGMAHFIEHMIFKGTYRRKTYHILNYLESVGGDLNAYTGKEKTCIYASIRSEYVDRATDLLTDIVFRSTFPEKEIVKERQVISEEIDLYRNAPDEAIFEDFDQMVFPTHMLGAPILGTKESISTFTKDKLARHVNSTFTQENVVYAIVGNVTKKDVERLVDKHLKPLELPKGDHKRYHPKDLASFHHTHQISTNQAHEIIGGRAYALRKEQYVPFLLLNNLLGGPSMNSRLSLNIREKYGLTYSINSFYSPFLDSGIWGVYYACEDGNLSRIRKLAYKEMKDFRERKLGERSLSQAKRQMIGQLTLSYESLLNQMLAFSKDLLDFGKVTPFAQYVEEIEAITAEQLQDAANEIFQKDQISELTYMPA